MKNRLNDIVFIETSVAWTDSLRRKVRTFVNSLLRRALLSLELSIEPSYCAQGGPYFEATAEGQLEYGTKVRVFARARTPLSATASAIDKLKVVLMNRASASYARKRSILFSTPPEEPITERREAA